jgi:hypothetical protein
MTATSTVIGLHGTDLQALIGHVVEHLVATPPISCRHLVGAAPVALVCAAHPAAGVACWDCYVDHARRHTDDLEHTCDRCSRRVERLTGVIVPLVGILPARTTTSTGLLIGHLNVGSIGLCAWCTTTVRQRAHASAS